ncbi:MAG: hypothetical protein F6J93_29185 [Oscillatoria sp. SIO1A7]|nr:hypothetical protein [Oscillatoria sp. SIO1A7]
MTNCPAILEVTLEITVSGIRPSGAWIGNNCWLFGDRLPYRRITSTGLQIILWIMLWFIGID